MLESITTSILLKRIGKSIFIDCDNKFEIMDRVWLVSEFYYPVVVTTGYYVTEIADYLSKRG